MLASMVKEKRKAGSKVKNYYKRKRKKEKLLILNSEYLS